MKNLLLSITILAVFMNVSNIVFAQEYDSTQYRKELQTSIKQDKQLIKASNKELKKAERKEKQLQKEQKNCERCYTSQKPNKFKAFVNYIKEEGENSRQQYIQTYHQQQIQNSRYNSSNYSNNNTRRDLADIVNRRSGSNYLK